MDWHYNNSRDQTEGELGRSARGVKWERLPTVRIILGDSSCCGCTGDDRGESLTPPVKETHALGAMICPICLGSDVYASHRRGLFARGPLAWTGLLPFRCSQCQKRFFRFGHGFGIARRGLTPRGHFFMMRPSPDGTAAHAPHSGGVAQLAERGSHKPYVGGSTPPAATIFHR